MSMWGGANIDVVNILDTSESSRCQSASGRFWCNDRASYFMGALYAAGGVKITHR